MRKIKRKKPLGLLIFFMLFPFCAFAQTVSVSGTITDASGETMVGVSVVESGTQKGTVSDIDGKYQITVASNATLTFSYLGYQSVNAEVKGRTVVNVTLKEDLKTLDEVVVVGYGTMKKSDLTGAVTSVTADAIAKSLPTSIDQVLQGRAAGVQVVQNSGMPGGTTSIRIRGTNSLSSSNEPIYVIDGVIIDGGGANGDANANALAAINPADIVSLDILKDASATAIYGARAANGVIIITTKRGQKGEASINYSGYMGWQQIPTKLDVLNLREYAAHRNVLASYNMVNPNNSFANPAMMGEGTDWQSELFKTAMMQSHTLSISGGNEKQTYNLAGGYSNQDGIAAGSGFKRLNLSASFDTQVKSWVKTGVNFAFAQTNQEITVSDQSLINVAIRTTPDVPVRNLDGSFAAADEQFMPTNPMAMALLNNNNRERMDVRANPYLEFTPNFIPGLTYRPELSFNNTLTNGYYFKPTYRLSISQFNDVNQADYFKQYNKYWSLRHVLTYNKSFGLHAITLMVGQEMTKSTWEYLSGGRTGFLTNTATDLNLGDATTASNSGYSGVHTMAAFLGRVFYSYDDKYLFTSNIRRDGTSRFAPGHRWGWFPSAAVAWRVSNEDFLKDNAIIDNLKLRLGWGVVGNQNIPVEFPYLASYGISTTNWGAGLVAQNLPNEELTWESTDSGNLGVDLNLFKNRVEFVADIYYKKTRNLLLESILPSSVGISGQGSLAPPYVNVGSLENKGIELALNTVNINKKDFQWRSNLVYSLNRNKILEINTQTGILNYEVSDNMWGSGGRTVISRSMVGQPIGQFYGYQIIGRFEKATDFYYKDADDNVKRVPVMSNLPIDENSGVWIGDFIYKDVNKDGVIDEKDRVVIGNPEPKFTFGIGNTFTYKNWDLTVFLTGSYGNDVINYSRRYMENPRRNTSNLYPKALDYAQLALIDSNGPNDFRNVQVVGGNARMPRMPLSTATSDYNYAFSDRYIEDGSYLRIQNISLGYTIPQRWVSKAGISNLKLYANLQNVCTFTKYSGYDPEIGISNGLNGVDNGRYPSPRIYTAGINLTF